MNYEKRNMSTEELVKELRNIIRSAIENKLDVEVSSIRVSPATNDDGEQILEIKLTLTISPRKWKPASMYDLINVASRAVRDSGEMRFPFFQTEFIEKQARAM